MSAVAMAGCKFGITMARPNRCAVNFATARARHRRADARASHRAAAASRYSFACPRSRRLRCAAGCRRPAPAQQLQGVAHSEAGDFGGDVGESAMAGARRQVQMQPGDFLGYEAAQESRGQDVIALAVSRTLQHVRDAALQIRVEVGVHGETPDPLAAAAAGRLDQLAGLRPVGECLHCSVP